MAKNRDRLAETSLRECLHNVLAKPLPRPDGMSTLKMFGIMVSGERAFCLPPNVKESCPVAEG